MNIHKIADGVRLVSVQTDRFKTSRIVFTMAAPLNGNISAKAILPYILHRRCRKYPDFSAFNAVLDDLYGASVSASVSKLGEAMTMTISITAVDDRFALDGEKISQKCVELLTDMIFDPIICDNAFPSDVVEEEKRLLIEKLEAEKSNKRRYALRRCEEIMFSNEAYGNNPMGTVEGVSQLSGKDIYACWLDMLKTSVMQITTVGSGNDFYIKKILEEKFREIAREPADCSTEFVSGYPKPNYVCEAQKVKQGKLVMGFRTGMRDKDDNVDAMRVAVDIFGGGTYSKLFSVVREKMSLCYYCSAALYPQKGIVMLQSGIENSNELKARAEIMNQLKEVAEGNFSDDDFAASVKSLCDARISMNDSPESICAWYNARILNEKPDSPEEAADRIRKVDRNRVVRAAGTIMLDTVYMLKAQEGEDNED